MTSADPLIEYSLLRVLRSTRERDTLTLMNFTYSTTSDDDMSDTEWMAAFDYVRERNPSWADKPISCAAVIRVLRKTHGSVEAFCATL